MDRASSDAQPRPRARLGLGRRLLYGSLPALLAVTGVELGFRWQRESTEPGPGYLTPDPYLGQAMRPGLELEPGPGLPTRLSTNSLGHRGPELADPKPANGLRLACLGGSTTWGFGASDDQTTYPARLAALLQRRRPQSPVEVLNAGVPGWTARTSRTNHQLHLAGLELDVLVVLHGYNDLVTSTDPRYVSESRAETLAELERHPSWARQLVGRSVALSALSRKARLHFLKHYKRQELNPLALVAFRRNLTALVEQARARGAQVVLCTYPHLFPATRAEAEASGRFGGALRHTLRFVPLEFELLGPGLDRYNAEVRDLAQSLDVPLVDLAADLPRDPALYVDFIHHSDQGQQAVAELVEAVVSGLLE